MLPKSDLGPMGTLTVDADVQDVPLMDINLKEIGRALQAQTHRARLAQPSQHPTDSIHRSFFVTEVTNHRK
jgi:hypothetical protein